MHFRRRVWYRELSLRCVCIRSSGIILMAAFVPNFVSITPPLLSMEKNRVLTHSLTHSLTRPAYLMTREPKLSLLNKTIIIFK